ncbi:MAG: Gx transporter family protein [Candidatus Zhuqueibacterota bacterium]
MSSPNNHTRDAGNLRLTHISLLVGLGLILFLFESLIPRPLPWLKPGLAHIATLLALFLIGNWAAVWVVVFRVIIGSLLLGSLFNPAFALALGGGTAAAGIMILSKRYFFNAFSIYGISILGAFIHNIAQLALANVLFVRRVEIFYLVPFMALTSIITGFIVAFAANLILAKAHLFSN